MIAASVVKRAASWAGASRSSRVRSAWVRWENMRPCSSRITSSTTCCTCTFWKYCAAAFTEVTSTTSAGIWYRMRRSWSVNISNAWSMTTGYSAVVPAITSVSSSTRATRGLWRLTCSRHSRASNARVLSGLCCNAARGVAASMGRGCNSRRRGPPEPPASATRQPVTLRHRARLLYCSRIFQPRAAMFLADPNL